MPKKGADWSDPIVAAVLDLIQCFVVLFSFFPSTF